MTGPVARSDPAAGFTLLDGPLGSELERRGVELPLPAWTAAALVDAPDVIAAIHRAYDEAGADVHTTATFRTTARALAGTTLAGRWEELARAAVALCRSAVSPGSRVAGSLAPLEDCFHPERTPDDDVLADEHAALAEVLADAGVDLALVETMPTERELVAATRAAAATGLTVWSAVTLGPHGDFFDADEVRRAADRAGEAGAAAFLINCTPADLVTGHLARLSGHPLRLGAYGNSIFEGHTSWSPEAYAAEVARWIDAGATIVGGCCGTTPAHVAALHRLRARVRDDA